MPKQINFLIVEDDQNDIQSYTDIIKTLNKDLQPDYEIRTHIRNNKTDGLAAIKELKDILDGAFIDLKLETGQPVEVNEGNELVAEIYEKLRFPVVVLTNTPSAFDASFTKSLFLQLKTKTDVEYYDLLMSIIEINKSGIIDILGRKGRIEKMLDEIFWKNISKTLPEWLKETNSEKPLLRYILTHVQEHLEMSDDRLMFDTFYPIESYITPPIKNYFFTGDIINVKGNKDDRYIILTPACDLAPHGDKGAAKAKDVLIAEIVPLSNGLFQEKITVAKKKDGEAEAKILEAKEDIKRIITNNFSPKYYFLPEANIVNGGLINFQKLSTVKLKDLKEKYENQATVTVQFVKDIISKFSFYYSRQGSPDFDFEKLTEHYIERK